MSVAEVKTPNPNGNNSINKILGWFGTTLGQILVSIFVPVLTFLVLWQGYLFLQKANAPQIVQVLVAIVWGVGGVALLYVVTNWLVMKLPKRISRCCSPLCLLDQQWQLWRGSWLFRLSVPYTGLSETTLALNGSDLIITSSLLPTHACLRPSETTCSG